MPAYPAARKALVDVATKVRAEVDVRPPTSAEYAQAARDFAALVRAVALLDIDAAVSKVARRIPKP